MIIGRIWHQEAKIFQIEVVIKSEIYDKKATDQS